MTRLGLGEAEVPTPPALNQRKPWHRRRLTWIACSAVIAIVAVIGLVWNPWRTVWVTDGSDVFVESLGQVSNLILEENKRVTESGRDFVSIAFMLPIRTSEQDTYTPTTIRHELEGAYLAQYWSNRENADEGTFTSSTPLIRLLIADTGYLATDWPDTVAQLIGRVGSEHLVAVAGLGASLDTTQLAVDELSRSGIPMFGAVITSSRLTAPNLARVSPTNADEAGAAIQHLKTTPAWGSATSNAPYKAYLVQDTAARDSYVADLGAAYRAEFPKDDPAHTLLPVQGTFDSSVPAAGNVLANQVNTICTLAPHIVFFAGRSNDLKTLLGKLAARPCAATGQQITVVSGDDIDHLVNVPELWNGEGITLLYTGLASPQSWNANQGQTISTVAIDRFRKGPHRYESLFADDLEDGHAIMAYDAVLTATEAARKARTEDAPIPIPSALVNGLHQINAQAAVPGASGWIYFQSTKETPEWLPYNKAVPILSLDRNGKVTFVRLSSRLGVPPGPPSAG
jgi:hypothetical protein